MKKFLFSLDFLLDYRKRIEDRLKIELAEITLRQKEEEKVLEQLERKRNLYQEELRKKEGEEKVELALILACESYLDKIAYQIGCQKEKLQKILQERENIRKKLLDASRQRKLLERVKEKRWLGFIYLREKIQQQQIDESALVRFYKKSKDKLQ